MDLVRMEPCIIRSIGMVDTRGYKFSHRRFSSDYCVFTSSRCVNPNISYNGGGKGRKGEEGLRGEGGEIWAREEVKVTGRRGDHIAKGASGTGAPLTFKSCVSLAPATVWF